MKQPDNHVDELRAGIKDIVSNSMFYNDYVDNSGHEPVVVGKAGIEALVSFVDQYYADFYRNKIPEKVVWVKNVLNWNRSYVNGYNQAIDDITAQFSNKDKE